MSRDPRLEPRPGDLLVYGRNAGQHVTRLVEEVGVDGRVFYFGAGAGRGVHIGNNSCSRAAWVSWAGQPRVQVEQRGADEKPAASGLDPLLVGMKEGLETAPDCKQSAGQK